MSSSTSSATATTKTKDAQTWVYPPPGAATPPLAVTSDFGPVHLYDRMILQWSPSTKPDEIIYVCFSESQEQSQWLLAKDQGQPFTYQFTNQAYQRNTSDTIFCHFYFNPSVMGNTVVWEFRNQPAAEIKTWEGASAPTSVSKTITSALSTRTGSLKSAASGHGVTSTSGSSSTSNSSPSSGGGLSTGASAGIGVGVAIGVLALVAALLFFFWRRRQQRSKEGQVGQWNQLPPSQEVVDYKDGSQSTTMPATTFGGEMQGSPLPVELGGSAPVELRGSTPEYELRSWNSKREQRRN